MVHTAALPEAGAIAMMAQNLPEHRASFDIRPIFGVKAEP
ncbi:hypothetical protein GGR61_003790 [Xanthomonas arboricola]|jgi:hypothetical protein|nr:hypothetical protein [Xanthomonas sp. 3058]